jgi:hypothetical protein
MSEIWKEVSVYSNYQINLSGHIRNKNTQQLLKPNINRQGYVTITLSKNNIQKKYLIHRLMALTFLPNYYNKPTVNHKNKIKTDNRLWNLEWFTMKEQNIHKNVNKKKSTFYTCKMKSIWRIDIKTNEKLEKYNNLTEAEDWCIKNNLSTSKYAKNGICLAALGKRNYALGYKWEYEKKNEIENKDEIWKEIPEILINGYKNILLSSFGRIKYPDGNISNGYKFSEYLGISIGGKNYKVHRLIAKVFLANPHNKLIVNHIDGNKLNAKLNNLEWNNHVENSIHAYSTGLNKNTKEVVQYDKNMNKIKEFKSINEASRELNVSSVRISNCCHKRLNTFDDYLFLFKDEFIDNKNTIIQNNKQNVVIQFDLNFNIIKLFETVIQAAKELNINKKLIYDCCNNKQKSTKGFIFMYKNKYNENFEYKFQRNTKAKNIIQLDLNMTKINVFDSIIKAATTLNISDSNISSCCKGKRQTVGGFKFMYLDDYNNLYDNESLYLH